MQQRSTPISPGLAPATQTQQFIPPIPNPAPPQSTYPQFPVPISAQSINQQLGYQWYGNTAYGYSEWNGFQQGFQANAGPGFQTNGFQANAPAGFQANAPAGFQTNGSNGYYGWNDGSLDSGRFGYPPSPYSPSGLVPNSASYFGGFGYPPQSQSGQGSKVVGLESGSGFGAGWGGMAVEPLAREGFGYQSPLLEVATPATSIFPRSNSASISFLLNDESVGFTPTSPIHTVSTELALHPLTSLASHVPLPLSPFDSPLPSSDCISWLVRRFWACYDDLGRCAIIQCRRFLDTSLHTPEGPASPLLWMVLWASWTYWEQNGREPDGSPVEMHMELTRRTKKAIVDRARVMLVAGVYQTLDELGVREPGSSPKVAGDQAKVAKKIVPLLQSLVLGVLCAELTGDVKAMLGLSSLVIKVAVCAATALQDWIRGMVKKLSRREDVVSAVDVAGELAEINAWMANRGLLPPVSADGSLRSTLIDSVNLASFSKAEQEEVVLFAEFCGSYFYCRGLDVWSSDLLGTRLQFPPMETDQCPAPFDGFRFEASVPGTILYSGSQLGTSFPVDEELGQAPEPVRILPVVPGTLVLTWMSPNVSEEQRKKLLATVIGDVFRAGPHFIYFIGFALKLRHVEIRFLSHSLGFKNLYPDGFNGNDKIRGEVLRLRELMKQATDAMPLELRAMETDGRIGDMVRVTTNCPTFPETIVYYVVAFFIWNYEVQAALRSYPPLVRPDEEWYESPDGVEAGKFAMLCARFVGKLLDNGLDVNDRRLFRWLHAKIDRVAYILFTHLLRARLHALPSASLFRDGFENCMRWLRGLKGQDRYLEWMERMMRADAGEELDPPDGLDDGVDKEQLSVRYAVSKVDRVLAGLAKGPMEDVERAVLDVLAGKDVVEPESDEE